MSKKGVLTVVSGLKKYDYELSISATTRSPREGEEHGREYFFLTREEFESMIETGKLIEWAEYVGNYYGTPKEYVEQRLNEGKDVILEIEIQGALKVREIFPDALLLFVTPPNITELKSRLVGRGTESMETIMKRLARASEEANFMEHYDYIIVNDDLDECVETTHQVIMNEHYKVSQNKNFIEAITAELKAMKEGAI